jgi:hypothetical protein
MSSDIELVQTALVEFDKVAEGLKQLETNYKGVVYDVGSTEGLKTAKAARVVLRTPRYEVERIRKSAKAPLLAIGKRLDCEAARIISAIMKLEDPIHAQISAEEDRIEAQKQAAIDAENERIADIHSRINSMRNTVSQCAHLSADQLAKAINEMEATDIDDSYQEFKQQAEDARMAAIGALDKLHAGAVTREAEAERVKAERAELEKLRAEQLERDRISRERLVEENRIAQKSRDEETAVQREELRREREQLEADAAHNRRIQAQRDAELLSARQALDAEQAALRAPKVSPLPSAENRKPSKEQILRVLADHFGVKEQSVRQWLTHYDWQA